MVLVALGYRDKQKLLGPLRWWLGTCSADERWQRGSLCALDHPEGNILMLHSEMEDWVQISFL